MFPLMAKNALPQTCFSFELSLKNNNRKFCLGQQSTQLDFTSRCVKRLEQGFKQTFSPQKP